MSGYVKAGQTFLKNLLKGGAQKTTGEAKDFVGIAKNLKKKRDAQDNIIKTRDEIFRDYNITDKQQKIELRKKADQPNINKKISKIYDEKAKGGRVGLRKGTPNPFGRKSNIQKIQEAFGTAKKKDKNKKNKQIRMMAKKGSPDPKKKKKFPDLTGDGKVTFADILKGRGVINGKKKTKKKII